MSMQLRRRGYGKQIRRANKASSGKDTQACDNVRGTLMYPMAISSSAGYGATIRPAKEEGEGKRQGSGGGRAWVHERPCSNYTRGRIDVRHVVRGMRNGNYRAAEAWLAADNH